MGWPFGMSVGSLWCVSQPLVVCGSPRCVGLAVCVVGGKAPHIWVCVMFDTSLTSKAPRV